MAYNIFQQGMDAFDNAYARTGAMRQDIARQSAGRKLATRDYHGAATDLGNAGMLDAVTGVQNYGQGQADRQASIQAATAYGNGDAQGAIQALGQTGDLKTIAAVQDQARQNHLAQLQYVSQEASKLQNVLKAQGPEAMLAAFDAQAPNYKAMGTSDQDLAQLRQGLAEHPDAVLLALVTPKHSFHVAGDSLFVTDDNTGNVIGNYTGTKFQAVGPDQTLYQIGGDNGAPGGQGNPQQPSGFDAHYANFVAPHEGGYTASDGNGAPANYGINQKANPDLNVAQLTPEQAKQVYRDRYWTPSGADKLPPALQAIQFDTAVNMGVGTAKQLLDQSGGDPQKYLQLRAQRYQQIAQANPSKASSLPVWLQRNNDLAQYVSTLGTASQGQGQGGPRAVAQGPMAASMQAVSQGAGAGLTGDAFLQTLPPQMQQTVKAISEGRMPMPSGMVMKTPYGQQLLQALGQYDPTFDAVNYGARAKTRLDFTSGASAKNLTAFNTALAHLSGLVTAINGLDNTQIPAANAVKNIFSSATGNNANIERFETVKRTAMDEVNKAIVGAGGALADREALMDRMKATNSPKALMGVVQEIADLLQGKINALNAQYVQGMGTDKYPIQMLTPEAQKTLTLLENGGGSPARQQRAQAAPVNVIRYDANGNRIVR
jgi:hypothetical protein